MGKNDIWVAATASIINAPIITIDKGFDHLNNQFNEVIYITDVNNYQLTIIN